MPKLTFVGSLAGNRDLAQVLAGEVGRQDAAAVLAPQFPAEIEADEVIVAAGRDCVARREEVTPLLARTVLIISAPPGSEQFAPIVELARSAGAVFHVNSTAAERLVESGITARHLQLGHSPLWEEAVAPVSDPGPVLVTGADGYFDWVEALRAIHRRQVVLHERCRGFAPLTPGRHLFVGTACTLDTLAGYLREDHRTLARVGEEAIHFISEALPLSLAAGALVGAARPLVAQPLTVR